MFKLLHLADLHLGKRLREYDLFDDQKYVLDQAIALAVKEKVDAVVVAGDIYDSGAPSGVTTTLLDEFITGLYNKKIPLLMISGNHDSPDKLHFVSNILSNNNIHIVTDITDSLNPITIDGINFYLLPYTNYQTVNAIFSTSYNDLSSSISFLVKKMNIDKNKTNVLVAHQSVLPSSGILTIGGSETQPEVDSSGQVGGSDVIPCSLFKDFDYVALGHIHKSIRLSNNALYPGSLLKYHKDEATNHPSFKIIDITNKKVTIEEKPISFLHDVVVLKGTLEDICKSKGRENDFVFAELTDKGYVDEAMSKLKSHYKYACGLEYQAIKHNNDEEKPSIDIKKIDKMTLFSSFYKHVTDEDINEDDKKIIKEEIDATWRGDEQ